MMARTMAPLLAVLLLTACGSTTSPDPASEGTPAGSSTDSAQGTADPSGVSGAAAEGSAAPGPVGPVPGGEPGVAPNGDGSALEVVPEELDLPAGWSPVMADGPHPRTQVCGVDLDPVRPRDAAQRRWALQDSQYLESEVHLFDGPEGTEAAREAVQAVQGCEGYAVRADGTEGDLGSGGDDVVIEQVPGAPAGWTVWTETTQESGMVRHIALAPAEQGWHWMSHVDLLGAVGPDLLLGVLPPVEGSD